MYLDTSGCKIHVPGTCNVYRLRTTVEKRPCNRYMMQRRSDDLKFIMKTLRKYFPPRPLTISMHRPKFSKWCSCLFHTALKLNMPGPITNTKEMRHTLFKWSHVIHAKNTILWKSTVKPLSLSSSLSLKKRGNFLTSTQL